MLNSWECNWEWGVIHTLVDGIKIDIVQLFFLLSCRLLSKMKD